MFPGVEVYLLPGPRHDGKVLSECFGTLMDVCLYCLRILEQFSSWSANPRRLKAMLSV